METGAEVGQYGFVLTPKLREPRDEQTFAIIGAAMTVHRELGHGFLEAVYREALQREFTRDSIPHLAEYPLQIRYRGEILESTYRCDFLCFGEVVVEIKALGGLGGVETSQVINYLKASGFRRGILLNFGTRSLEYKRLLFDSKSISPNLCESV